MKAGTRCTGLMAVWCPNHGECRCPATADGGRDAMTDPDCPLHSAQSDHPR